MLLSLLILPGIVFSVGFTVRTILPLRMLWGGTCTHHLEALVQNTLALVVHLNSIICLLMQLQAFKSCYVTLNFGLRVIQVILNDWSQPWEVLPRCLAQAYSLLFLPQVLLIFPIAMLSKFCIFFGASSFQSFTLLCFSTLLCEPETIPRVQLDIYTGQQFWK